MQSAIVHQLSELGVEPVGRNGYACCYPTAFGQVLVAVLLAPEIDILKFHSGSNSVQVTVSATDSVVDRIPELLWS
jgi:hypothetical protein